MASAPSRRTVGLALVSLLGLAACTGGGTGVRTEGDILSQNNLLRQMRALYTRHAIERGGCAPTIFNPVRTTKLEEDSQKIILQVDYTYGIDNNSGACSFGRGSRKFQVNKTSRGLAVVGMSGDQMG